MSEKEFYDRSASEQLQSFMRNFIKFIGVYAGIFFGLMAIIGVINRENMHNIYRGFTVVAPVTIMLLYVSFPLFVAANIRTFIASGAYWRIRNMDGILDIFIGGPINAFFYVVASLVLFPPSLAHAIYHAKHDSLGDSNSGKSFLLMLGSFIFGHIVYWLTLVIICKIFSQMD